MTSCISSLLTSIQAAPLPIDLTRSWLGMTALAVFLLAYLLVANEEPLGLRKSMPVVLAAGLIWALVALAFVGTGDLAAAAEAFREHLLDYGELFLFILVATTFVNTMEERQVFDVLRARLVRRGWSLRALFWVTGLLSFLLSPWLDNLTTALVMGTVAITMGKGNPKFVTVASINVVVAANAGGAFSPFGDLTTLMVWQAGRLGFTQFFPIFLPCLVNWLIPAFAMSFAVPRVHPATQDVDVRLRVGGMGVIYLFAATILVTVTMNHFLHLPPVAGMMTGLGLLYFYSYSLKRKHGEMQETVGGLRLSDAPDTDKDTGPAESVLATPWEGDVAIAPAAQAAAPVRPAASGGAFDVFRVHQRAEWDTLLFFYGIIMCVGGLATLGYLARLSHALYPGLGPTLANTAVGAISSVLDNIPVMFSVLEMRPAMDMAQWQLVTLTAGVGGSILSIGSAAGVALMGQARGTYTFLSHLRWSWAIALGYVASIGLHLLLSGA